MSKFNSMIDSSDNAIAGTTSQMTLGQNLDQPPLEISLHNVLTLITPLLTQVTTVAVAMETVAMVVIVTLSSLLLKQVHSMQLVIPKT